MKSIDIDDDVYSFIASQTQHIGESASDILRRLLNVPACGLVSQVQKTPKNTLETPVFPSSGQDVFDYLREQKPQSQKSRVERFLLILSVLHQYHQSDFARLLDLKGRNRVYFALDKQALLKSGSSTNPKQVPGSEFWVITNNNTNKKASMLQEVAMTLGYQKPQAQELAWILAPELRKS